MVSRQLLCSRQSQKYNLINFYLLLLVFLKHTVGVEHGGVLHLFNIGAWLRSLGHKEEEEKKKVNTDASMSKLRLNELFWEIDISAFLQS